MEHWANEYWDFGESRWVLADVDGYYEYEPRFGCSQFDLPRRKFVTASEAWLGLRKGVLHKKLDVFSNDLLEGVCEYLFMDFHALMNNEIFIPIRKIFNIIHSGSYDADTDGRNVFTAEYFLKGS